MLGRLFRSLWPREAKAPASLQARPKRDGSSQLEVLSRLASIVAGEELVVSGKETPAPTPAAASKNELPIMEVIAHAQRLVSDELPAATAARVQRFERAFAAAAPAAAAALNVFVFHVDMPAGVRIDYVDAQLDPRQFDYVGILARFIERARVHAGGSLRVYLVTAEGSPCCALGAADVTVVELPIDGTQPMYDRATALLAYARSRAFDADTLCLDSDALINRPPGEIFELGFDVALTYREAERLMPINEGVMLISPRRPLAAARFLERRLATYDRLAVDEFIVRYYGDVKRWRGGQLALNAVAAELLPASPYREASVAGARLRFLPCDSFNFTAAEGEAASSIDRLAERYVIHYKGWRKQAFRFAAQRAARRG